MSRGSAVETAARARVDRLALPSAPSTTVDLVTGAFTVESPRHLPWGTVDHGGLVAGEVVDARTAGPAPPATPVDSGHHPDDVEDPRGDQNGRWTSLADLPVGPDLLTALSALPAAADLDDHGLLEALAAQERAIAGLFCAQVEVLAEFGRRRSAQSTERDGAANPAAAPDVRRSDFAADEVMARMRWTSWTASHRLDEAERLAACLPVTWTALGAGRLDYPRVRRIVNATRVLSEDDAAAVDSVVADVAGDLTTAQLDELLAAEVAAVDAAAAARRAARATARRRVGVTPLPDGQAELVARGPAADVLTMFRGITHEAGPSIAGDDRGVDARRFDALRDWARATLDDAAPARGASAWRPHVLLTVALSTVLGLDDHPGHLHGYGPLPADLARQIAAEGTLRRLLTDDAGVVIGVDGHTHPGGLGSLPREGPSEDPPPDDPTPDDPPPDEPPPDEPPPDKGPDGSPTGSPPAGPSRGGRSGGSEPSPRDPGTRGGPCPVAAAGGGPYRPHRALDRLVRLRDGTCTAVGCRLLAAVCDLDHVTPHPDGPTCACNLHPLCRRHHRMKHRSGTSVRRLPDGRTEWTMPTGHVHLRPPRPALHLPAVSGRRAGRGTVVGDPAPAQGYLVDSTRHELAELVSVVEGTGHAAPGAGGLGPPPF